MGKNIQGILVGFWIGNLKTTSSSFDAFLCYELMNFMKSQKFQNS